MDERKPRKTPWPLVLMILAFCLLLAYGVSIITTRLMHHETFGTYRSVSSISNVQDIQVTSKGFVYYDGYTVSCMSSSGKVKWSYMVGADASFEATDSAVAAWSGATITVIDSGTGKTTFNKTMDEDVIGAHVGSKYTLILTGDENDSTAILMENGGRELNKIILEDVTAVDYGFFSDDSLLWIMVCDTNGTVPTCNIQTYKPGREIVGSISDTQQLMYAVLFQSNQVVVAGDTYLKTFDYTGTEDTSRRQLIWGWYLSSVDKTSSNPLMALVTDSQYGESKVRDVRIMDATTDTIVRMPFDCLEVVAMGDTVYGFAADGHVMLVKKGETKVSAYRTNLPIDKVYGVTNDGIAVVSYGGAVYLLSLV